MDDSGTHQPGSGADGQRGPSLELATAASLERRCAALYRRAARGRPPRRTHAVVLVECDLEHLPAENRAEAVRGITDRIRAHFGVAEPVVLLRWFRFAMLVERRPHLTATLVRLQLQLRSYSEVPRGSTWVWVERLPESEAEVAEFVAHLAGQEEAFRTEEAAATAVGAPAAAQAPAPLAQTEAARRRLRIGQVPVWAAAVAATVTMVFLAGLMVGLQLGERTPTEVAEGDSAGVPSDLPPRGPASDAAGLDPDAEAEREPTGESAIGPSDPVIAVDLPEAAAAEPAAADPGSFAAVSGDSDLVLVAEVSDSLDVLEEDTDEVVGTGDGRGPPATPPGQGGEPRRAGDQSDPVDRPERAQTNRGGPGVTARGQGPSPRGR